MSDPDQIEESLGVRRAVYAGSFDPITRGHVWVIQQGAGLFDELVIAVGHNPDKSSTFSVDERIGFLEEVTSDLGNVKVTSFAHRFLIHFAQAQGANYILRGLRNPMDFESEQVMRIINADLDPRINTIFVMPPRRYAELSSSFVKGLVGPQGWEKPCRFVAQRIPKEREKAPSEPVQFELFEDDRYKYRIFVTSQPWRAHKVVQDYDGRAGAENLIGEANREGLAAIPGKKFQSNKAYFQIVMLSYNLWRYMVGFADLPGQRRSGGAECLLPEGPGVGEFQAILIEFPDVKPFPLQGTGSIRGIVRVVLHPARK